MGEADPAMSKSRMTIPSQGASPNPGSGRRRVLTFSVPIALAAAGAYVWLTSGHSVTTDNASVQRDIASISSAVDGRIADVRVRENELVKKGDILFVIDQQPYQAALDQAEAQISDTQLSIGQLQKDYRASSGDIGRLRVNVYNALDYLRRQKELMVDGFTTKPRLRQAEQDVIEARKALNDALKTSTAMQAAIATGGQTLTGDPQLLSVQARRDQAALNLAQTTVRAPITGRIGQSDHMQVGQLATAGLPLVTIVAGDKSWVTANFKETDLNHMRIGQKATIALDAYPDLHLTGTVESIGAKTGSQVSAQPAQTADSEWVKVTQRVPVRIAIEGHPSRSMIAGLSAKVTVDLSAPDQSKAR
jgi:membrane fusion protein (multidrug efflux system)